MPGPVSSSSPTPLGGAASAVPVSSVTTPSAPAADATPAVAKPSPPAGDNRALNRTSQFSSLGLPDSKASISLQGPNVLENGQQPGSLQKAQEGAQKTMIDEVNKAESASSPAERQAALDRAGDAKTYSDQLLQAGRAMGDVREALGPDSPTTKQAGELVEKLASGQQTPAERSQTVRSLELLRSAATAISNQSARPIFPQ
jgi:hypothetical protein